MSLPCGRPTGTHRWAVGARFGVARPVRGVPIPRCGHLCQEERPEVVNSEILGFLADWTD